MKHPKFLIAATSSGCGKTTLSLGLMRALTCRGLKVQPFKCGPDYIDTQFHSIASGKESINLDTYMASENHVRNLFDRYSATADVSVIEGVMGMLDGYSRMKGSSADISRLLDVPVILLVNAASTAYSVAATIYGFKNFLPDLIIAGVIFNRVASESHFNFLKDACSDAGAECLGYIRRDERLVTPSRHLGLTLGTRDKIENYINSAAEAVEEGVDLSRLLEITSVEDRPFTSAIRNNHGKKTKLNIAVARDEAFSFIYPANISSLRNNRHYDVTVTYFSPIHDLSLPDTDFVYLPGGYPELFAEELEINRTMRESIKRFADSGGRIFGECGGMIYLGEELDGKKMCDVLPIRTTMADARLSLGYRTVRFKDVTLRGHEFHYSKVSDDITAEKFPTTQTDIRGKEIPTPVYRYKNVLAGYTHLYWAENDILQLFDL